MTSFQEDLTQAMAECLQTLLGEGFEPPLHVAGVAINGSAFLATYLVGEESLVAQFRLEPDGDFQPPVNMMFVDSRGEAARLVMKTSGKRHLRIVN